MEFALSKGMRNLIRVLYVAVVGINMAGQAIAQVVNYSIYDKDAKTRYFREAAPQIDFEQLLANWQKTPGITLENAITTLPKSLRLNYSLIHTSGSLQEGSFENPRAILSTPTANVVISFNGSSDQVGGNSFEAMVFNTKEDRYDFYEATFRDGKMHSELNPTRCLGCHTDMRLPNWKSYSIWNGSYGAVSHIFQGGEPFYFQDQNGFFTYGYPKTDTTRKPYEKFLAKQKDHPRYKYLIKPSGENFWPLSTAHDDTDPYDYQPMRRLGIGLAFHQARSISTRLERSPIFRDYSANVVAALLKCDEKIYSDWLDRVIEALDKQPLFLNGSKIRHRMASRSPRMGRSIYQLLAVSGLPPEVWSMDLSERSNVEEGETFADSFIGGFGMADITTMVGAFLFERIKKDHPEIKIVKDGATLKMANAMIAPPEVLRELDKIIPLYLPEKISEQVCVALAPLAQDEVRRGNPIVFALNEKLQREITEISQGKPYVLRQCAECHSRRSYETAPFIPFEDPAKLQIALNADSGWLFEEIQRRANPMSSASERMPHGPTPLLPSKYQALMKWLTKVRDAK